MSTRSISVMAVSIAIVAVLVAAVPIPNPMGGFTHPGAIAEVFIAVAFGPVVGAVAAGLGAAIADLVLGYGSFAPLTLIAHGLLGYLVGLLGHKKGWSGMLIGWVAGGLALVAVYYVGEATIYDFGAAGAAAELPLNLGQVGLGILGLLLFELVKRAYPQIEQMAGDVTFKEE